MCLTQTSRGWRVVGVLKGGGVAGPQGALGLQDAMDSDPWITRQEVENAGG